MRYAILTQTSTVTLAAAQALAMLNLNQTLLEITTSAHQLIQVLTTHLSFSLVPHCGPTYGEIACLNCDDDDLFFSVNLPEPTTDDLEIRVCADEPPGNEDIRIESMDFYIR